MGRNYKFPKPHEYKPSEPAVICPGERVLSLFTQETGVEAKKIAKKVRKWFIEEARKVGWAGVHFLTEVQSNHGAGCVLWRPPESIQITVTKQLVLVPQDGDKTTG